MDADRSAEDQLIEAVNNAMPLNEIESVAASMKKIAENSTRMVEMLAETSKLVYNEVRESRLQAMKDTERPKAASSGLEIEIDTLNKHAVSLHGDEILFLFPPHRLSKRDALTFAAQIVAIADDDDVFAAHLHAVRNA